MSEYFFSQNPNPLHLSLFKRFLRDGFYENIRAFNDPEDYESLEMIVTSTDFNINYHKNHIKEYQQLRFSDRTPENVKKLRDLFFHGGIKSLSLYDRQFFESLGCSGYSGSPITIWKNEGLLFHEAINDLNYDAAEIIFKAGTQLELIDFNDIVDKLGFYHTQMLVNYRYNYHECLFGLFKIIELLLTKDVSSVYHVFYPKALETLFKRNGEYKFGHLIYPEICIKLDEKIWAAEKRIIDLLAERNVNPFSQGKIGELLCTSNTSNDTDPKICRLKEIRKNYEQRYLFNILRDNTLYFSLLPPDLLAHHFVYFIL